MIRRIVVAGGGTGGHLFPGIAVVEELRRRLPELNVLFIGTERGIEARLLPRLGEFLAFIPATPLMGRTLAGFTQSVARLPRALVRALRLVRTHKPDLVIGLGGYAAGPVLLAAKLLGVPTAILEQNTYLGLTNRLLASWIDRAYLAHEAVARSFKPGRALVCGNPVRRSFVDAAHMAAADPEGVEARSRYILVVGGSQGAQVLNQTVPEALVRARVFERGIHVIHQTGAAMCEAVQRRYREEKLDADVVPFIEDMARAYTSAILVVARAGATSLAEMCAIGRPSILIPYPHAAEGHQEKNAYALEHAGAAVVLSEASLTPVHLAQRVSELLDDTARRRAMADAARKQGRVDAAALIVDDIFARFGHQEGSAPDDSSPENGRNDAGTGNGSADAERIKAASRRPRVKRCELRVREREREFAATADAAG